jgi:hypothetical protein
MNGTNQALDGRGTIATAQITTHTSGTLYFGYGTSGWGGEGTSASRLELVAKGSEAPARGGVFNQVLHPAVILLRPDLGLER